VYSELEYRVISMENTLQTRNTKLRKAFGKFGLDEPLPLRKFENLFRIDAREGPRSWVSSYVSVQKLLDHLQRFTKSESSKEVYLNVLRRFCEWSDLNPTRLVHLPKTKVEELIQSYVDELATEDKSKTYINSLIKRLRTFFKLNGYLRNKELIIRTYHVPSRYRKTPEYIPTKQEVHAMADAAGSRRDRAIIFTHWSSGVRVSTLCALNYEDIQTELENDDPYIMIPVYPAMKRRVSDSCKGGIAYYTFCCPEAGRALRTYLKDREEKFGPVALDDPLFHSDWTLWTRTERPSRRLGRRAVGLIVKKAAKLAGLSKWKNVTCHCLRKSFQSVLRSPTVDGGRMDKGTQEFLMGHILPGTQDPYYDRTKVSFHRTEYSKLDFSREGMRAKEVDKLIDVSELESYLEEGFLFVAKISNSRVIVRKAG